MQGQQQGGFGRGGGQGKFASHLPECRLHFTKACGFGLQQLLPVILRSALISRRWHAVWQEGAGPQQQQRRPG